MIKDTTYITPEYILGGIFPHVEGEKIEFKQNMTEGGIESYRKTLCAFANHIGGSIFFGINDKTREIVGVEFDDTIVDIWKIRFDDIVLKLYPYFTGKVRMYIYKLTSRLSLIEVKLEKNDNDDKIYYMEDGFAFKRQNASNRKIGYTELVERSKLVHITQRCEKIENEYRHTKKLLREADERRKEEIEQVKYEYMEIISLYDELYRNAIIKIEGKPKRSFFDFIIKCMGGV
jgi:predicted HTH transcriptional regulator